MADPNLPSLIRATIGAYVKGFADSDLDAICALFGDDARIEDPVGSPKRTGAEDIRAFYRSALSARPRLTITGAPVIAGAFSATPISATVEMAGKVLVIDFISVMSYFPDGRIKAMTAYFDPETIHV